MLRRYLPDPEAPLDGAWTPPRLAQARALVRRLLEAHDAELPAERPHAELIALASHAAAGRRARGVAGTGLDARDRASGPAPRVADAGDAHRDAGRDRRRCRADHDRSERHREPLEELSIHHREGIGARRGPRRWSGWRRRACRCSANHGSAGGSGARIRPQRRPPAARPATSGTHRLRRRRWRWRRAPTRRARQRTQRRRRTRRRRRSDARSRCRRHRPGRSSRLRCLRLQRWRNLPLARACTDSRSARRAVVGTSGRRSGALVGSGIDDAGEFAGGAEALGGGASGASRLGSTGQGDARRRAQSARQRRGRQAVRRGLGNAPNCCAGTRRDARRGTCAGGLRRGRQVEGADGGGNPERRALAACRPRRVLGGEARRRVEAGGTRRLGARARPGARAVAAHRDGERDGRREVAGRRAPRGARGRRRAAWPFAAGRLRPGTHRRRVGVRADVAAHRRHTASRRRAGGATGGHAGLAARVDGRPSRPDRRAAVDVGRARPRSRRRCSSPRPRFRSPSRMAGSRRCPTSPRAPATS